MINMLRGMWSNHDSCIDDLKNYLLENSSKTKQAIIGSKPDKKNTHFYAGCIPINDNDGDLHNVKQFRSYGYTNIEIINASDIQT